MLIEPKPLEVTHTEEVYLHLQDGRKIIDGLASWWTACHGYNPPSIVSAIIEQAKKMPHVALGGIVHEPALSLASALASLLPGDLNHAFFSESGSLSVEVALKMAKQFFVNTGHPARQIICFLKNSYHGDTLATMQITDADSRGIERTLSTPLRIELPDTELEWEALFEHLSLIKPCAFIVEPVLQGVGGMLLLDSRKLLRLLNFLRSHGTLIIFDEIFTGFGRTGTLFALEALSFVPDIVCLSKGLTGGTIPFAATVARSHIFNAFLGDNHSQALWHSPTYGGNPLGAAAALANLEIFSNTPWAAAVARIEQLLQEGLSTLAGHKSVKSVRAKGAMGVVELHQPVTPEMGIVALKKGVFLRPFKNIIYTTPSFTITPSQLNHIIDAMKAALP